MGLASALSTALTGLTASETTIDVVGNNLANSNTVGFKASKAIFATQFLQTHSLGSAPTATSGGTNPRQVGLGTMVAGITPDFTPGTIQISSNPTDMAIQGDGFFIVEGSSGEQLFSRNGIFKMNAQSQLVTATGNRVLGYAVDSNFEIQTTTLEPLTIPLGSAAVAKSTNNAYLEGTLSPTGDLANRAEIIQTGILGDAQHAYPSTQPNLLIGGAPNVSAVTTTPLASPGGVLTPGATYEYAVTFADKAESGTPNTESAISVALSATLTAAQDRVQLSNIVQPPTDPTTGNPAYSHIRIYRRVAGATDFHYLNEITAGTTTFTDDATTSVNDAALLTRRTMDTTAMSGNYSYYVTFKRSGGIESRPSPLTGPINVVDGRVHISGIPTGSATDWDERRIYRNLSTNDTEFHLLTTISNVDQDVTFTDNVSDATLAAAATIDLEGPKIIPATLLTNVRRRDGSSYEQVFQVGTLAFTSRKGGRTLNEKEFSITATTTVQDLINFMGDAMGIQEPPGPDSLNPITQSLPPVSGDPSINAGGSVTSDGRIRLVGNNGTDNAINIGLSGMQLTTASGEENINMPFSSAQTAVGEGAVTDMIVYDSLGIPLAVRVTVALDSRDSTSTTYRWYADSPDNDPSTGVDIGVGTGLIRFDGEGNFVSSSEETISIDRRHVSSASPLEFELDFSNLSGLATDNSTLAVSRQDGSGPGVLSSFIVGEDGIIRGVFSNGITRDLGQIRLARFGNPAGLEQKGENVFATGVNSGLPVVGNPGEQGIGSVIGGSIELSNTDIGSNLIDLILASTMYRGNTRVITTSQQMLDELLSIRR